MPLQNGETVVIPFLPVAIPYLVRIKVLGREKHMGKKCIKLTIGLQKSDVEMSLKHYEKLKPTPAWLSAEV